MHFNTIPQFTRAPGYSVTVPWDHMFEEGGWLDRQTSKGLELEPDFQRAHVWDDKRRSKYVEFVLRGGESSRTLLFNCKGWMSSFEGPFQLVDGLQRLTAARMFMAGQLEAFGHTFNEFEGPWPSMLGFVVAVNSLNTRREVLQWYLELNSGGIVHSEEELERVRALLHAETSHD